jgi:hypothetical protein
MSFNIVATETFNTMLNEIRHINIKRVQYLRNKKQKCGGTWRVSVYKVSPKGWYFTVLRQYHNSRWYVEWNN